MRRALHLTILSLASLLVACGDAGGPDTSLVLETSSFTIPAGESFMCYYMDTITDRELSVTGASGQQGRGAHHLTLYYVDHPRPVGAEPCSGTSEMVDWHFTVGAGGEGNGDFINLAEGLAVKIPKGKQLMIQSHYINTSGAQQQVRDELTLELAEPADVKAYAGDFVVLDDTFEVPALGSLESVTTCEVKEDVQLTMLLGHMHSHGVHYKLEEVDGAGEPKATLYEQDWRPEYASHPPIDRFTMEAPLRLAAGTRLRQTCSWNNNTPNPLIFPTEMCIAFGYYFPGESRVLCEQTEAAR